MSFTLIHPHDRKRGLTRVKLISVAFYLFIGRIAQNSDCRGNKFKGMCRI